VSYLLFMDESGHDHRNLPYEVRGGIALHAGKVWPFVSAMRALEQTCFGDALHRYKSEIKGHKLLDKDRFKWAAQSELMDDAARRKHALAFLNKGVERRAPVRDEFTAFGQGCLEMARGIFRLLRDHDAKIFAAVIPRGAVKPDGFEFEDYLRKDHVFLLERYFYFLESKQEHGLLVMDESEKTEDRRFVRRMESYFTKSQIGRYRSHWVVPSPFFVASDMAHPIQAADVCIYCINVGFRVPRSGMTAPARQEVASEFGPWLREFEFEGDGYRSGQVFRCYGICYVPDPYTAREP